MRRLEFETEIAVPCGCVWRGLTDPECFRRWASEIAPGSHLAGRFAIGEEIRFLTPEGSGMITRIVALEKDRHLEFEVIGVVADGRAEFATEEALARQGGREAHRLAEIGDRCRLAVEVDVPEAYREYMQGAWTRALAALKELAEAGGPGRELNS